MRPIFGPITDWYEIKNCKYRKTRKKYCLRLDHLSFTCSELNLNLQSISNLI